MQYYALRDSTLVLFIQIVVSVVKHEVRQKMAE